MTDTFTWAPSFGAVGTTTFRARTAQFGDGYSQVAGDGLNNASESWPLTFVGDATRTAAIKAFLDQHPGYISFFWTPPGGVQGLFRCMGYTRSPTDKQEDGTLIYTVTATFTQSFSP